MRKPIFPVRTLDDALIRDEGWENKAYPDPLSPAGKARAAGKNDLGLDGAPWTIGVGHTGRGIVQGLEWTDQVIQAQLNIDIRHAALMLQQYLPWSESLDKIRYAALQNMAFNLGLRLLGFKKMLEALEYSRWDDAAKHALDSLWAKQVGARATRISNQFRDGVWQ